MSFLINPYAFLAAGGDFESIATITVGSGGASSIEFTSIPGTYQHLQVRALCQQTYSSGSGAVNTLLRLNSDSGSGQYPSHYLRGDGSTASAGAVVGASYTYAYIAQTYYVSSADSIFGAMVIDLLDYADTSKNTTIRTLSGYDANGSGRVHMYSSLWISTSAVTGIEIFPNLASNPSALHSEYSTFALYGVRA